MADQPEIPDPLVKEVQQTLQGLIDDATSGATGLADQRNKGALFARALVGDIDFKTDASPQAIQRAKDEVQVVALRLKGLDMRSIARSMGWVNAAGNPKVSTVNDVLKRALTRWYREGVEELRSLELERLDAITYRIWPIIEASGGKGDDDRALRAIDRYMQVSARRAALVGLDAPLKQVFKGEITTETTTHIEIDMIAAVNEYLPLVDLIVAEEMRRAATTPVVDAESQIMLPPPEEDI